MNHKIIPYSLFKPKKTVRFQPFVNIQEIPNRDHLVAQELWWTQRDYALFMKQSHTEIQYVLLQFPHIRSPKMARYFLYQPDSLQPKT